MLTVDFGGGEQEISFGDLDGVVGPTLGNEEFVSLVYGGVVPDGFQAGILTEHLALEALRYELDDLGVEITETDMETSKADLLAQVQQLYAGSPDPAGEADRLYDEVPYLPFLADYQAAQNKLSGALVASAEADSGNGDPCVRHILVETEAEGDDIQARLADGEDFSALAVELSTGPSGPNGGDLGCAPASNYVPEFAEAVIEAEVGEYVGPVQTDFGFHVLVVDRFQVDARTIVTERLRTRLGDATVDVDESVGTWDNDLLTIIPASESAPSDS